MVKFRKFLDMNANKTISLIVPVFNEAKNIPSFYVALKEILETSGYRYEILFINDGSEDSSAEELVKISGDERVKILDFSRNFGKEIALTAGLNHCSGEAAIMIDADFQHPLELIPDFLAKWERGAEVVVGVRQKNKNCGLIKRYGSFLFYKIINRISEQPLVPNSTDFRLLDRVVIDEFNKFTERNRLTRALIAWLGFRREYIYFEAKERRDGLAAYNVRKLISLAMNSFISLSLFPLKMAGYLGIVIVLTVGPFGLYVLIGKYLADWYYASSFSGPAQLALLLTFLVGIVLCSLGLVALYIAHIHKEVLGRPLYVLRGKKDKYEH